MPTAPATCIAPASLPINRQHAARSPGSSPISVAPARFIAFPCIACTIRAAISLSCGAPKSITSASNAAIKRSASAAYRSGSQHFADPYAAPGANAIRRAPRPRSGGAQALLRRQPCRRRHAQLDAADRGQLRQPARALEQFQIIIRLVRRRLSRLRHRNRLGQQPAPRVSRISDALRNPRAPRQPGRLERILQQQRRVKFFAPQFCGQPLAAQYSPVPSSVVEHDHPVCIPLPPI